MTEFMQKSREAATYSNIEGTGFTRAYTIEPMTFRSHENYTGELPLYSKSRLLQVLCVVDLQWNSC